MNSNSIVNCPQCNSANPYFNLNCKNCNSFLREKIPNINLGEIILLLIESPKIAFEKIIISINKNYLSVILVFLSLRFYILSKFISVPFNNTDYNYNLFLVLIYFLFSTILTIILLVLFTSLFMNRLKIYYRTKDIFAVLIYSFIPTVLAIIFVYPIELAVYGKYLFSNNPYPFEVKETVFYLLAAIEIFLIIWSFILQVKGLIALKLNAILSVILSLFNYSVLISYFYFSTKIFNYL